MLQIIIDPEDPRIQTTWGSSKECFSNAGKLFSPPIDSIEIPYEETTLPGYFYRINEDSDNNNNTTPIPRPTLVAHGGFDSTLDELYASAAAPALERGYNCLTFEGPGQGGVIRKQKIPFRFDWEKVVTSVVDYALTRDKDKEIDRDRIALMGISMGGYLAARAVAFEHRISACILYNLPVFYITIFCSISRQIGEGGVGAGFVVDKNLLKDTKIRRSYVIFILIYIFYSYRY